MSSFTPDGIELDRYQDVLDKLIADFKAAFGDDIKTTADSVTGQVIRLIAGAIAEQNELVEGIVSAFNPQAASGIFLSNLVMFNGITRNENEYSTVPVTVTAGTAPTTIPAGSLVSDPNDVNEWSIDNPVVLVPFETKTVSATCTEPGPIEADPGTITKIKTPVYSWETVTNLTAASPGQTEETDTELRARRERASKATGQGSEPSIFKVLTEIEGVERVNLYVNKGFSIDPITSVPPQHIWAIVRGGNDADIAQTLVENVAGGIGYYGSIMYAYYDEESDRTYIVYFDRPVDVPVYVKVTLNKQADYPADGDDQMKQNIVDYYAGDMTIDGRQVEGFGIGDTVEYTRHYTPINSIPGHTVADLRIDTVSPPIGQIDIPMAVNEQAFIEIANIEILTA